MTNVYKAFLNTPKQIRRSKKQKRRDGQAGRDERRFWKKEY